MTRDLAKQVPARIKVYTRENWGAPFIVGFMLLLMVAAVSLSIGVADVANEVAIYAYYALVVGVVLQLVCFLKYRKKDGELD
jgi:heme/copper-type cytochrome/quinol oxidase subunit 4